MTELPKLTDKQQKFVLNYITNGNNATDAYRKSYDCTKMSDKSITVEASKLLKNPNVTLWLNQANCNVQEVFQEEIKYSVTATGLKNMGTYKITWTDMPFE